MAVQRAAVGPQGEIKQLHPVAIGAGATGDERGRDVEAVDDVDPLVAGRGEDVGRLRVGEVWGVEGEGGGGGVEEGEGGGACRTLRWHQDCPGHLRA